MDCSDYKVADNPARLYHLPGSEYAQFEYYGDYFTVTCSTAKQVDEVIKLARKIPVEHPDFAGLQSLILTYGTREPQPLSFSEIQKRASESPRDVLFVRLHLANDLVITWRASQIEASGKIFPAQVGLVSGAFYVQLVTDFLANTSTYYVAQSAEKIATNMATLHKDSQHV